MAWPYFSTLRTRLIVLVLLAVAPVVGLMLYSGAEQHRKALAEAETNSTNLAMELTAIQKTQIEKMRQTLITLSQSPQVQQLDAVNSSAIFTKLLKQSEGFSILLACDVSGDVFASAITPDRPINSSDRPWFQRAIETRDFVIGEFQLSRITGKAQINAAYPVIDDEGQVKGVVSADLDLVWLNNHWAARNLPQGATCNVVDRKGMVLARYPDPEGLVGTSISASPIFRTILSEGQGATDGSAPGGMPCVVGFAPLAFGSESIYVYVTTPREVAFAKAHHELLLNLGLSVIVFVLTLFATWLVGERFILRQVNSLLELTKEVAGGNLASRGNVSYTVGELGQLAHSFDKMIESLQYREGLRQQAQDQMLQMNEHLENILENSPDGIGIVDTRGKFVKLNRMAAEQ